MVTMWLQILLSLSLTAAVMGAVGGEEALNCSYVSLLRHLGVGPNNHTLSSIRPVNHWTTPTYVLADLYLYVIIDVNEKFQSFTTEVFILLSWTNEFISWDPKDFCGIKQIGVPKAYLWRPDISIYQSMEVKLSSTENSEVYLLPFGFAYFGETYKITSTCKMDLYKFPFDTQQCRLTFLSNMNTIEHVRLLHSSNSSDVTTGSLVVFQAQGEWDLISIHVSMENITAASRVWDMMVYTITITRRPQLYVINFLVPIFLFLVLDLASYFISEARGEKLSFKVTILLAISVLLLILHDILPSTDQKTPVIGMFCTGVFMFVGCSIMETIVVGFLMRTASKCDGRTLTWKTDGARVEATGHQPAGRGGAGVCAEGEMEEGEGTPAGTPLLRLVLAELQALRLHLSSAHPEHAGKTCLYLKTAAKSIHAVYFLVYVCAVSVFLAEIGQEWYF